MLTNALWAVYSLLRTPAAPTIPFPAPTNEPRKPPPPPHITYDYIIHDVFTGGAEPLDLFTVEFLTDLASLLDPDRGVIAINYAGDLNLPLAHAVVRTVFSVFPICRIFRETSKAPPPPPSSSSSPLASDSASSTTITTTNNDANTNDDDDDNSTRDKSSQSTSSTEKDYTNLILFCLPPNTTATYKTTSFTFRNPTPLDMLGTRARRDFLLPNPELEMFPWEFGWPFHSPPPPPPPTSSTSSSSLSSSSSSSSTSPSTKTSTKSSTDNKSKSKNKKDPTRKSSNDNAVLVTKSNIPGSSNPRPEFVEGQTRGREGHWWIMRGIIPGAVWENY